MLVPDTIIKSYIVTEKAANLSANLNQYTFEVATHANRIEVARAIEKLFNVAVTRVNILNRKPKKKSDRSRRGKTGTTSGYKKAIVSLKDGDTIEIV
jgi:large subunit ribosomal protein L23